MVIQDNPGFESKIVLYDKIPQVVTQAEFMLTRAEDRTVVKHRRR